MTPGHAVFWLVAGHFVTDYPLQGDTVAIQKNRNTENALAGLVPWPWWLTAHALQHGAVVLLILGRVDLAIAETICHWVIDLWKCDKRISLNTDQTLHLMCKAVWFLIWVGLFE